MKIEKMTLTNFMPYKGVNEIAFPSDPDMNVLVIHGDNMRGKTSILNAMKWAFYGKAYNRHSRPIPSFELINSVAKNEQDWSMSVEVSFFSENTHYSLKRTIKKKISSPLGLKADDYEMAATLQKGSIAMLGPDIEEEISRIVPEQISRFFLFDGELLQEYENLLIDGSDQGEKIKEAIEQVLGVPAITQARGDIATILKGLQRTQIEEIKEINGSEFLRESLQKNQEELERKEKDAAAIAARVAEIKEQKETIADVLEKNAAVGQAKIKYEALSVNLSKIQDEERDYELRKKELADGVWIDFLQPRLNAKHEKLSKRQKGIARDMDRAARLQARIEATTHLLDNGVCPTCQVDHTAMSDQDKQRHEMEIDNDKDEVAEASSEMELFPVMEEMHRVGALRKNGTLLQIIDLEQIIARKGVDVQKTSSEMEHLRGRAESEEADNDARSRREHDMLSREEGRLAVEHAVLEEVIRDLRNQIAQSNRTIARSPEGKGRMTTALIETYSDIELVFRESAEKLRERLREKVQAYATEAFQKLSTQKKYKGLVINKNYGLTILNENGDPLPIRSAGAEQIVALSLIEGLAKIGHAAGPVIMDTPFGRLDKNHRSNILNHLPSTASQLVLLVHSGEIEKEDLSPIRQKIGGRYNIVEITPSHSMIQKA